MGRKRQRGWNYDDTESHSVSEFIDAATIRSDAERRLKMHARVQIKQQRPVIKVESTLMYDMVTRTTMRWTELNSLDPATAGRSRGTKSHRLAKRGASPLGLCTSKECMCA